MRSFLSLLLVLALPVSAFAAGNTVNDSFNRAKKLLDREVYTTNRLTVYCGVPFDKTRKIELPADFETGVPHFNTQKGARIVTNSEAGLKRAQRIVTNPEARLKRAQRLEWEHAVPAENFGRAFVEWREGDPQCVNRDGTPFKGRKCAEKMNMDFRHMHADMHNLFPSIGLVNADRSNYRYAELPGQAVAYGVCPAKVDTESRRFEPPDRAKGMVARASLYMDESYPVFRLSDQQKKLFEAWDKKFPPDAFECERNRRIAKLQGNDNPFITRKCR